MVLLSAIEQEIDMYKEDTTFLGLRVGHDLKASLEKFAKAEGRSVSNWVARVLAKEVERLEAGGE